MNTLVVLSADQALLWRRPSLRLYFRISLLQTGRSCSWTRSSVRLIPIPISIANPIPTPSRIPIPRCLHALPTCFAPIQDTSEWCVLRATNAL